jgi:hypothetical protein
MTTYDTNPNTQTIAAAWAFSPLGQPEREVRYGFATTGPVAASDEQPTAKRVMLTAALSCGIAAGALVGVMFFVSADSAQPTVVAPGAAPQHAVVVGPSTAAPAPKPVVSEQSTAPAPTVVNPAPRVGPSTAAVATPPVAPQGDTTVVVDVPIPAFLSLAPSPKLNPQPEPPSLPNFIPPAALGS